MFGYKNISMQIKVPYFKSKFCNVLFTAVAQKKNIFICFVYIDCILKLSMMVSVSKLVLEFTTIISHKTINFKKKLREIVPLLRHSSRMYACHVFQIACL